MNGVYTGISIAKIQVNAPSLDAEQLHRHIMSKVDSGEYETYLEALSEYADSSDLDMSKINRYISPALRCILLKEATERNLLKNPEISIPDEFFT